MSRVGRLRAEVSAAGRTFARRRTAVFFTFGFPLILVVIFGVLVDTRPGTGLFTEPPTYYLAGYLAVVVLFTPLSRVGSEVARHREGNRFEKLATTPLGRREWLAAQTLVNGVVVLLSSAIVLVLVAGLTGADLVTTPATVLSTVGFVVVATTLFCGLGAVLGALADSQDGVVAASNGVGLPLLFLSETFVPPALLPAWVPTWASPLTYFARGVREVTTTGQFAGAARPFAVLTVAALGCFLVGAALLPRTD